MNSHSLSRNPVVTRQHLQKKTGPEARIMSGGAPYREGTVSHAEVLETVEAPQAWADGYDGRGVGIAILDSGIGNHSSLAGRVRAFKDFSSDAASEPTDSHWHGTSMAGAAAAAGAFPGVAPAAHLLILKVANSETEVMGESVTDAVRWVIENQERYNIGVINMSFSLDDPDPDKVFPELKEALGQAVDKGIIPVAAVGNSGVQAQGITRLSALPETLAVGGSDGNGTADSQDDEVLTWSSRAPKNDPNKPEVLAPGVGMLRPMPGERFVVTAEGGTSAATAVTSGVAAVWKQAEPELTLDGMRDIIQQTAMPLSNVGPEAQGHGVIRIGQGLKRLKAVSQPRLG